MALGRISSPSRLWMTKPRKLSPGEVLAFDVDAGAMVLVEEGVAWITQAGDAEDHLLRAHDLFRVTRTNRLVVQALRSSATITVSR